MGMQILCFVQELEIKLVLQSSILRKECLPQEGNMN